MSPVRKTRSATRSSRHWSDGLWMAFHKNRKRGCCTLRATALLTPPVANKVGKISERFLQQIAEEAQTVAANHEHFPDERLKLLFVCAPPAIDAAARTPLMLQTVLGVDAARIASALLVSPAAMGQRLVRDRKQNPRDCGPVG
jgi:predicted RNA polymerase sigma factor